MKQKILAEIEKRYEYWKEKESNSHSIESEIRMSECQHLLLMLDSLQEEPVSEDLKVAAQEYEQNRKDYDATSDNEIVRRAFKAGAKWQFNQFEKNRLAACDRATDEEIKREQNFVDKIIIGEHRQPTYSDAIEYGIKWQKEKMMQDAVERVVKADAGGYPYIDCNIELYDYDKDVPLAKKGDKYKVVLIKEE